MHTMISENPLLVSFLLANKPTLIICSNGQNVVNLSCISLYNFTKTPKSV